MQLTWQTKPFDALSLHEFHDLLQLRIDVFVVEQDCPYPELDNKDQTSFHLLGQTEANEIVAYARILPPGLSYAEVSVGRVVVKESARGHQLGRALMLEAIQFIANYFGQVPIRISAQVYLTDFYLSLGFQIEGEEYLEDGIPHIEMVKA